MKFISRIIIATCISLAFLITGCDKTKPYDIAVAPPQAHFAGDSIQSYAVLGTPAPVFNLVVGTTDVSSADRVVTYSVISTTGAAAGTEYTIDNNGTVTIPAGKATASIDIRGNAASYANGESDTLIFSLSTPSVDVAAFQNKVTVVLSGCSNAATVLADYVGDYDGTTEVFGTNPVYGPYHTAVSSFTSTGATTGTVTVENIFDDGWGPIIFDLDWTNPNNATVIVEPQSAIAGSDGAPFGYPGQTVAVKAPTTVGTFDYCSRTLTLQMQLGITGLGFFGDLYTVNVTQ